MTLAPRFPLSVEELEALPPPPNDGTIRVAMVVSKTSLSRATYDSMRRRAWDTAGRGPHSAMPSTIDLGDYWITPFDSALPWTTPLYLDRRHWLWYIHQEKPSGTPEGAARR